MSSADLIDHILRNLDEVIFPALAAYAVYILRAWMQRTQK